MIAIGIRLASLDLGVADRNEDVEGGPKKLLCSQPRSCFFCR